MRPLVEEESCPESSRGLEFPLQSMAMMTPGLFRELCPGLLAPEARIMPLDQTASWKHDLQQNTDSRIRYDHCLGYSALARATRNMRVRVPVAECQPQTFFLLAGPSSKTQDTCGIRAHAGISNRVVIAILSAATVCRTSSSQLARKSPPCCGAPAACGH